MTAAPDIATPRERPLIFSAAMILRLLDGSKTMTRRIVPRPSFRKNGVRIVPGCDVCWAASVPHNGEESAFGGPCYLRVPACEHARGDEYPGGGRIWPKWNVGDVIWVKETFSACRHKEKHPECVDYRATFDEIEDDTPKWTPSIFMPRALSRITLEVVNVRAERLHEITEDDAKAEGVPPMLGHPEPVEPAYRDGFRQIWDAINGDRAPWDSNPFVNAISFRRIKP